MIAVVEGDGEIPPKPHADSRFCQQTLPSYYPQHTPCAVAITLAIITVVFIPLGACVIVASDNSITVSVRYDAINNYRYRMGAEGEFPRSFPFGDVVNSTGAIASVRVTLKKTLVAPVFMQYRLRNFHQNYRQVQVSMDEAQLYGGTNKAINDCNPFRYPGELQGVSVAGYYNPCGAVAWMMFNDTFTLYKVNGGGLSVSTQLICNGTHFGADGSRLDPLGNSCHKKGIAFSSDSSRRFRPPQPASGATGPMWANGGDKSSTDPYLREGYYFAEPGHRIPSSTDEDLMVWTRPGGLSDFTKMYRIIDVDLVAGDYLVDVEEHFDVASFKGEKLIVLQTRSWVGGRQHVLGILLLISGCIAFVAMIAIIFAGLITRGNRHAKKLD